jgi:catechol 2,3-dioxygenase-like lactoylglutathione lyase family enzyme
MNIEFLSTLAVIAPDPAASRKLYVDTVGLPLDSHGDDYHHSEHIAGCKSFGIWPLSQAAEACFGTSQWPAERLVPQVSIEFDVADAAAVTPAARELEQAGYELLHHRARSRGIRPFQAAVTGGRDHRDLLRPCASRPALTEGRTPGHLRLGLPLI